MNERIEKKEAQIKKIEKRIAKWESKKNEGDFKKSYQNAIDYYKDYEYCKARFYEEYLNECDVEIRRANKDLQIAKQQLENIKMAETKKIEKENTLDNMPVALVEFKKAIIKVWNEYDADMKEKVNALLTKDDYKEFIQIYDGRTYSYYKYTSIEEMIRRNEKDAESLILNLYYRVEKKVGKIVDASGLSVVQGNRCVEINGTIVGDKDSCVVESIGAGGYNIQRYHIRTLVK